MKLSHFRLLVSFCIILCFGVSASAQSFSPVWLAPQGDALKNFLFALAPTSQNGWLAVGSMIDEDGQAAYWLTKLDSNRNLIWQQLVDTGADGNALFYRITTTPHGYLLGGQAVDSTFSGWHESDTSANDALLVEIDTAGSMLWGQAYGGSGDDVLAQVIPTHDGGYAFVGTTNSSDGDIQDYKNPGTNPSDVWIEKVDSAGEIEWERTYGGSGVDLGVGIAELPDHSFGVIANTHSGDGDVSHYFGGYDIWLLRLDSGGNKLWDTSFGSSLDDAATGIATASDGTMLIAGQRNFRDTSGAELPALWAAKLDTGGHLLWELNDTEWRSYLPSTMCKTASDGLLLAGGIPHPQEPSTPFAAELRSDGTLAWRDSVSIEASGIPFMGPNINAIAPANGGFTLVGTGGFDTIPIEAFVGRFNTGMLGVKRVSSNGTAFEVFPSPAHSSVNIRLSSSATARGTLYNSLGEAVERFPIGRGTAQIDVSHLPRGIYYIEAFASGRAMSLPVVVQ